MSMPVLFVHGLLLSLVYCHVSREGGTEWCFLSSVSNQSIPLIPWTSEQEEAFSSPTFRQLLGELGFHLPSDTGKLYPRIPHFWCPDVLYMVAKRLGDITDSKFHTFIFFISFLDYVDPILSMWSKVQLCLEKPFLSNPGSIPGIMLICDIN